MEDDETDRTSSTTDTMKDDTESSSESESSLDLDELDDVKRLVIKTFKKKHRSSTELKDESELPVLTTDGGGSSEGPPPGAELEKREEPEKDEMMTKEEQELKKEEERRDKMKVLLSGYLELKTQKEIEKALLNEKKIVSQWLYPFRGAYQKEWEAEMRKLRLGFQKALDYKKSHIHAIQRERRLLELNHLWADSAACLGTEELFEFMRVRCEKLKERYLEELEETKRYYLEREKEIADKCTKAEERSQLLARMRNSVRDKTLQKTQETLYGFKMEGEFLRAKEMELIKDKHSTYVEMIARELQASVSPPEHRMDEVRGLFGEWKKKYDAFMEVSEKNRREMEQFGVELPRLESKVSAARKKLQELKEHNRASKQQETQEVVRLQRMAKKHESLRPALREMISSSEEVMVKLRERRDKLDKIVKLKKFCDRLEIEGDKISPGSSPLLDDEDLKKIQEKDCLPLIRDLCSGDVEDPALLENLLRKLSRVKLQNKFLQYDLENLRIENRALRSDMKKYLHLIASGEWKRISDVEFDGMAYQDTSPRQKAHETIRDSGLDEKTCANLQLLERNYGAMNEEIIKRAEKF